VATELKLPEVGEGIDAGTVVAVLVKVGDVISVDQPILELETDKAVVEVPSTAAGTVTSVAVKEGQEVPIGTVVLTVEEGAAAPAEAGEPETKAEAPKAPATSEPAAASTPAEAPAAAAADASAPVTSTVSSAPLRAEEGLLPAAPSVRRLARELGVDLHAVQGSGILGRIDAEDVRAFAGGGRTAAVAKAVPNTGTTLGTSSES